MFVGQGKPVVIPERVGPANIARYTGSNALSRRRPRVEERRKATQRSRLLPEKRVLVRTHRSQVCRAGLQQ